MEVLVFIKLFSSSSPIPPPHSFSYQHSTLISTPKLYSFVSLLPSSLSRGIKSHQNISRAWPSGIFLHVINSRHTWPHDSNHKTTRKSKNPQNVSHRFSIFYLPEDTSTMDQIDLFTNITFDVHPTHPPHIISIEYRLWESNILDYNPQPPFCYILLWKWDCNCPSSIHKKKTLHSFQLDSPLALHHPDDHIYLVFHLLGSVDAKESHCMHKVTGECLKNSNSSMDFVLDQYQTSSIWRIGSTMEKLSWMKTLSNCATALNIFHPMHPIFNWTIILCNQLHDPLLHAHLLSSIPTFTTQLHQKLQSDEGVGTCPNFFGIMEFGFRLYGICRDAKSDEGVV